MTPLYPDDGVPSPVRSNPLLCRLRRVLVEVATQQAAAISAVEDQLGFALLRQFRTSDAHCGPAASVTFGTTRGVQLGMLPCGLVIMTAPAEPRTNIVLAPDLQGFLRLGAHFGFEWLVGLTWDWNRACRQYGVAPPGFDSIGRILHTRLRAEFALVPYPDVRSQLEPLQHCLESVRVPGFARDPQR